MSTLAHIVPPVQAYFPKIPLNFTQISNHLQCVQINVTIDAVLKLMDWFIN